jgi:Lecithin:cholesterol acyltransferase/Bacterial pre-peptidase C-terminal domain
MRAAAVLAVAIVALLAGTGSAAADVHTGEPFEDPACWSSSCEAGGAALTDLVDGNHDWSSAPSDFLTSLLDIQLATGVIPALNTVTDLSGVTLGTSPVPFIWRLAAESGDTAAFRLTAAGFGSMTSDDADIGPFQWNWSATGLNGDWANKPGFYLFTPVGTTSISISNCLQASAGTCRESDVWNSQKEEEFYEAMVGMGVGHLLTGPCSLDPNNVQTCQFARYISPADFWNSVTIDAPLEPSSAGTPGMCTGYADPLTGAGVTLPADGCGTGPDPNPLQSPTLSSIDGKDDPTRARFNCLLRPSFTGCGATNNPPPGPLPPLIFLPGTLGSYLANGGDEKWPNLRALLASFALHETAETAHLLNSLIPVPSWDAYLDELQLDSQGVATDGTTVNRSVGDNGVVSSLTECVTAPNPSSLLHLPTISQSTQYCPIDLPQYGATIAALVADGYRMNSTLFPLGYDWRYGAEHNANDLLTEIDWVLQNTAAGRAAGQVDILAHSQGGLVAEAAAMDPRSLDPATGKSKIARIVTLGTPYLGTPKFLSIFQDGQPCEFDKSLGTIPVVDTQVSVCMLSTDEQKKIVQNFPGSIELLPDKQYYAAAPSPYVVYDARAKAPDPYTWQDMFNLFAAEGRNTGLVQQASDFHDTHDDWNPYGGTQILRVYGTGQGTVGEVYSKPGSCVLGLVCLHPTTTDLLYVSGDGTVAAWSAADANCSPTTPYDGRGDPNTSFSQAVSGLDHMGLAQSADVIGMAVQFFSGATPGPSTCPGLSVPVAAAAAARRRLASSDDGLTGTQLEAFGPVVGVVQDDQGNLTGSYTPDGSLSVQQIPDARFDQGLNSESFFFQDAGDLKGTWVATATGEVQLKLRSYAGDTVTGTVASPPVDVQSGAVITLGLSPAFSALQLQVDDDGNGTVDRTIPFGPPVSGAAALDLTPPTSTVHVDKRLTLHGLVAHVTVNASDSGGAGVSRIEWFTNANGQSGVYTHPLDLPAKGEIYVRAIDGAGNVQADYSIGVLDDHPSLRELVDTFSGPRMAQLGFLDYPGDIDWWGFRLPAGRERFDLAGLAADYDLALYDASGNEIAESDNRGLRPESIIARLAAGTYYIRVSGHQLAWSDTSPYLLSASPTG